MDVIYVSLGSLIGLLCYISLKLYGSVPGSRLLLSCGSLFYVVCSLVSGTYIKCLGVTLLCPRLRATLHGIASIFEWSADEQHLEKSLSHGELFSLKCPNASLTTRTHA